MGASAYEDIDITATGSSINITSTESDANAIKLIANTSAGGIVMDSGTSGLNIDSTGQVNIKSAKNGEATNGFNCFNRRSRYYCDYGASSGRDII